MKKQILIGTDSFEKIIGGGYFYIDKTMFIKELLENRGEVTLITRPRRFGKTLNMSMLKNFFNIEACSQKNNSKELFDGLNIMGHKDIVDRHMNKYPVIFITLKNIEAKSFKSSIEMIKIFISKIYRDNIYLIDSDRLNHLQKKDFNRYCSKEATEEELASALY